MRRIIFLVFILSLCIGSANAQILRKNAGRKAESGLFGKTVGNKKEAKVKEPRSVLKAKKKQEAKERKVKKDYAKAVKRSQKRTIEIQTPEVQARMKQNQKDAILRDKIKKKTIRTSSKKAGRKYN
jgi:hypothetical protein